MKKWKVQTENLFEELCNTYEKIVLVGHSMGTLLSVRQALRRPEKVALLFLVAVPTPPFVRPMAMRSATAIAFDRVNKNDFNQTSMRVACGMRLTKKLWKYAAWLPRMIELLAECRAVSKCYGELTVSCIAWQSEKDELVARRSIKVLQKSGRIQVNSLPNSTHVYYPAEEQERVLESFRKACEGI